MAKRKIAYILILFLLILVIILSGRIIFEKETGIRVYFLDVGQGDATLIVEGNKQLLIDGGPNREIILEKLGKIIPFWDREIEVVVATHPDSDHLSGLVDVLERYEVGLVLESGVEADSEVYRKFEEIISNKNIQKEFGREGMRINFGKEANLEVLSPFSDFSGGKIKNTNLESIVAKLSFGENSFLFMADAPEEREKAILERGRNVEAQVFKVGHHGSKYSTSQEFLEKVKPRDAILSVGAHNRYGHPTDEVLERIMGIHANLFRTDQLGDIEYFCPSPDQLCEGP